MNQGEQIIQNIARIKNDIINSSIFNDKDSLTNFLTQFSEEEQFEKYLEASSEFNSLISANIRELHENLEIFYTDEDTLRNARLKANKEFSERYNSVVEIDIVEKMFDRVREKRLKEQAEKDKYIKIGDVAYEVVKKINVLWSGWECDQYAYAVKTENGNKLVASNHGELMFVEEKFFEDKINEYKKSITDTEELLKTINN